MKNLKNENLAALSQKMDKNQILDALKQKNIKGGTGCPPPVGANLYGSNNGSW